MTMHTTSLALLVTLASGVALVGCETHDKHHHSESGSYETNRQLMTSDTVHSDSSAVSTGGAAGVGVTDNRNTNSTDASDRPRAGAAVQQDADRQGSASGITDNRNVNRSEGTPSSSSGTAMTPKEKNRSSPQGPSADNGDTGRSAEPGAISNRTSDNGNQTGSMDNTVPRAGSGVASDKNDGTNVQRSENSATTQPAPRSASDE